MVLREIRYTKQKCLKCKKGRVRYASSFQFYCDVCGAWHYHDNEHMKWKLYEKLKIH